MTAPEPTPTAEHIDAVARACLLALHDQICPEGGDCRSRWPHAAAYGWFDGPRLIRDVSTDPAVHAAMLAALVRAGALTEEAEDIIGFHDETCPDPCPFGKRRRLVTGWEVAP